MPELNTLIGRLTRGAIAGALATWAMKGIDSYLESRQSKSSKKQEEFVDNKSSEEAIVDQVSSAVGWNPSKAQRKTALKGVKWGLGVGTGVATAWLRRKTGATDSLMRGALFGATTFLIANEVLKPAIGARGKPTDYPWESHARALSSHTTYGLVNAGVREVLKRAMPTRFTAS